MLQLLVAALALAGTILQMLSALHDVTTRIDDADDLQAFRTVDQLRDEIPRRRPIRRWRHRALVRKLLRDSPTERAGYLRLRRILISWTLLVVAAGSALTAAATNL